MDATRSKSRSRDNAMRKMLGLPQDPLFVLLEKASMNAETPKLQRRKRYLSL